MEKMVSYTQAEMDAFASQAKEEFPILQTKDDLAEWWKKWYMKCGHKRLGRIVVAYAKELTKQQVDISLIIRT